MDISPNDQRLRYEYEGPARGWCSLHAVRVDLIDQRRARVSHHPRDVEGALARRAPEARERMAERVETQLSHRGPLLERQPDIASNVRRVHGLAGAIREHQPAAARSLLVRRQLRDQPARERHHAGAGLRVRLDEFPPYKTSVAN